jgi:hypothetical protein
MTSSAGASTSTARTSSRSSPGPVATPVGVRAPHASCAHVADERPPLAPDMTETPDGWTWTPAQSTLNYEVVTQLVNASDPPSSRLLRKPLADSAGVARSYRRHLLGLDGRSGVSGRARMDPDAPTRALHAAAEPPLDFEFYRTCVQQHVRRRRATGSSRARKCHAGGFTGFAPRAANGSAWTEEEARRGFEAIQRLILPGRSRSRAAGCSSRSTPTEAAPTRTTGQEVAVTRRSGVADVGRVGAGRTDG